MKIQMYLKKVKHINKIHWNNGEGVSLSVIDLEASQSV